MSKVFFSNNKVSPVCLQWKKDPMIYYQDRNINDLSTSNNKEVMVNQPEFSKSTKKNSGSGLQELPSAINIPNNNERMIAHPELTKKQRRKSTLRDQDFLWTS
jgi:hypothetical protein